MKDKELKILLEDDVYPPSEDTFLLLEAIHLDPDDTFLEVGCGSGYISIVASMIAKRVVAIDIDIVATRATHNNAQKNGAVNINVVQGDLLTAISPAAKFSVIAFNPPYLPRDDESSTLDHALVGGINGIEVTERFIEQASLHLAPSGSIYVVASSLADVDAVVKMMQERGLNTEIVATRKFFYEEIVIVRGTSWS